MDEPAIVGDEDDERVLREPKPVERGEETANAFVEFLEEPRVVGTARESGIGALPRYFFNNSGRVESGRCTA